MHGVSGTCRRIQTVAQRSQRRLQDLPERSRRPPALSAGPLRDLHRTSSRSSRTGHLAAQTSPRGASPLWSRLACVRAGRWADRRRAAERRGPVGALWAGLNHQKECGCGRGRGRYRRALCASVAGQVALPTPRRPCAYAHVACSQPPPTLHPWPQARLC